MTWRRFAVLGGILAALYHSVVASQIDLVAPGDGGLRITDFAYYAVIVRAFWLEGHRDIYSLDTHLAVMRGLLGADMGAAMPLGVTPVGVFVLAPFALLSTLSLAVAQSAWVGASLAAVAMMLAGLGEDRARLPRGSRLRCSLAIGVGLGSFACLTTLLLGQTSLAALAALGLIVQAARVPGAVSTTATCLALLVVGVKPTYLAFALLVAGAYRRWRLLAWGLALTAGCGLAFTALAGPGWWRAYWDMLGAFSAAEVPPEFRSAFAPAKMNIFRSAWAAWARDAHLLTLSMAMALGGAALAVGGLLRDLWVGEPPGSPRSLSRSVLAMGSYLLFSPYASTYEDVLLVLPVLLLVVARPEQLADWKMLPLLAALLLSCNALLLMSPATREALWCAKTLTCVLAVLLLTGSRRTPARPGPVA